MTRRPTQIKAPAFPDVANIEVWKAGLARALITSSVHSDEKEIDWFLEIESAEFEMLNDSGGERFLKLDCALSQALIPTCPKDLQTRINRVEQAYLKDNKIIKGRQVVYMVYKWFEVKDGMGFVYSYKDLIELKLSLIHI
mgnify:FL=1